MQPAWDVEMDVVWEGWGSHEEEIVDADDGNFAGTSEEAAVRDFRDAWSFRLGSTVQAASLMLISGRSTSTPCRFASFVRTCGG